MAIVSRAVSVLRRRYLEGDQARFVDKEINGKKVTDAEQGEQYQQKIAEFAKARGIPADEIAQLGGAASSSTEGPQDVEDSDESARSRSIRR